MSLLLDTLFSSVALGHLMVDLLNGQRAVLLTYLSGPLGLSNTELGLASTLYLIAGSLSQPAFGFLTDRIGPRWVAAGGVLFMAVFFSLALITPGPAALYLLMVASVGSGAFHPAGTMQATLLGQTHFSGRETTSAAYFFFFGQAGSFFGPMLGGPLLERFGPMGLLLLSGLGLPVAMNTAQQLRQAYAQPARRSIPTSGGSAQGVRAARLMPLAAFGLLAALQAWTQQNMITFVPKYLSDLGESARVYGVIVALFMGGSAFGTALGGALADRYGKRRVAVSALALSAIPLYLISSIGGSAWLYILVPLAGFLTGSVHSIIVVMAQRILPGGMAFASGLILGFMFSSGAVGTLVSGYLADVVGFPLVFMMTAGTALSASFLAFAVLKRS